MLHLKLCTYEQFQFLIIASPSLQKKKIIARKCLERSENGTILVSLLWLISICDYIKQMVVHELIVLNLCAHNFQVVIFTLREWFGVSLIELLLQVFSFFYYSLSVYSFGWLGSEFMSGSK